MAERTLSGGQTWAELARVAAWAQERLGEARVQKIRQPDEETIVVECRAPGQSVWVTCCARPRFGRVVVEREKPAGGSEASAFCGLLRKHLDGGRLAEIAVDPNDRIFTLAVERGGEVWTLAAELFGPQGNLLCLAPDGTLAGALHENRLASRGLRVGEAYVAPGRAGTPKPLDRGLAVEEMAAAFAAAEAETVRRAAWESLANALRRDLRKTEKHLVRLTRERDGLPDGEDLTRRAQLLVTHLTEVPKGARTVTLADWADPEVRVRVDLDPALSPRANAERMFKDAKRSRRKREHLEGEIARAEERLLALGELDATLKAGADESDPEEFAARLRAAGVTVGKRRQAPPRRRETRAAGPRPFLAADGATIYVGRSAAENDEITFQLARGNDVWLHAGDGPGSHVVVRLPAGGEVTQETLLDAATLALLHSSRKGEGAGDVIYTRRKFVRKPKDAKPGLVYTAAAKTIHVRLDQARIARLYASRDEAESAE